MSFFPKGHATLTFYYVGSKRRSKRQSQQSCRRGVSMDFGTVTQVTLNLTLMDFFHLITGGAPWSDELRAESADGRFLFLTPTGLPEDTWKSIYWIEEKGFANTLLARAYLDSAGIPYEFACDEFNEEAPWVLLTPMPFDIPSE